MRILMDENADLDHPRGHAQHLDIKTLAGPVPQNPQVLDTLSGSGVDLIYGDTLSPKRNRWICY